MHVQSGLKIGRWGQCSQVSRLIWSWSLWLLAQALHLTEDVKQDDRSHVNKTDEHDCVWLQLESVSLLIKECKLVSLGVSWISLHV